MSRDDDHRDLPPGVAPDTPGARPPRALEVARRMRIAANAKSKRG